MKWPFKRTDEKFNGFLDHGTSCTGELSFEGTFRIDGEFHGSITTSDSLVIGPRATVHADITAGEVKIHGSVSGNIVATRRVEIGSTGRLRGDVRAAQLTVEDGAVFEGRSYRTGDTKLEPAIEATVVVVPEPPERAALPEKPPVIEKPIPPERQDISVKPGDMDRLNQSVRRRWADDFPP